MYHVTVNLNASIAWDAVIPFVSETSKEAYVFGCEVVLGQWMKWLIFKLYLIYVTAFLFVNSWPGDLLRAYPVYV